MKVSEYGASLFRDLRKRDGLDDELLLDSFSPKMNEDAMFKFQEGSGKSECFFYYTENKRFVIKTLKDLELRRLIKKGLIENYNAHLKKNPKSLLARIYGVYKIKVKFMKPISLIIMENIIGSNSQELEGLYDLKGSSFQRFAQPKTASSVLKDNNFLLNVNHRLSIGPYLK